MQAVERTLPAEPTDDRSSDEKTDANAHQRSVSPLVPPSEGMVSPDQDTDRENDKASGETYKISHTAGPDSPSIILPRPVDTVRFASGAAEVSKISSAGQCEMPCARDPVAFRRRSRIKDKPAQVAPA
jgi:hypothetical protein